LWIAPDRLHTIRLLYSAVRSGGWRQRETEEPPFPLPADERTETAAQALHSFRHLAGTASVCGQCRAYARVVVGAYNRNR
jgi:hypothetical protein